MDEPPYCGECGDVSQLYKGDVIYPHRPDLHSLNFWRCVRCGAYCGCHKGTTKPLGTPAGPETRKARSRAHRAFDQIWKDRVMSRKQAYVWLRDRMRLSEKDCHIGRMTLMQANEVTRISLEKLNKTMGETFAETRGMKKALSRLEEIGASDSVKDAIKSLIDETREKGNNR